MDIRWVEYRATVPDWSVPDLNRHVAEASAQAIARAAAPDETEEQRVRRTFHMIKSPDGRRLAKVLALLSLNSPNGSVEWTALCGAMNMRTRKLSGVLGGVIKSTKDGQPLFERDQDGGRYRFRMAREVATAVHAAAREAVLLSKFSVPIEVIYRDYEQMITNKEPGKSLSISAHLKNRYGVSSDDWLLIKSVYERMLAGDEFAAQLVARVDDPADDLTPLEAYCALHPDRVPFSSDKRD